MQADKIPIDLIEHINRQDCVLFVGEQLEGIASAYTNLAAALTEAAHAHSLCRVKACKSTGECSRPHQCEMDLAIAAQIYENQTNPHALLDFVQQNFEKKYSPAPILRTIATLPIKVIVTTLLDDQIERALEQMQRPFLQIIKDEVIPLDDPEKVQVIRLRGTINQPDSLVLTTDDDAAFFTRLPKVHTILKAHFANKTLFFIGYDLSKPFFLDFYRQITQPITRYRRPAFALSAPVHPLIRQHLQNTVTVLEGEPLSFLTELMYYAQEQRENARHPKLPSEPYKFLDFFTAKDKAIFFGRELEADILTSKILSHKLNVFYGRSGTGKTSLLQASVIPNLQEASYRVAYARMLSDPVNEIKAAIQNSSLEELSNESLSQTLSEFIQNRLSPGSRLVIILDQFEEFFLRQGETVRQAFAQELATCLWPSDPNLSTIDIRLAFSLRDDYLGDLDEIAEFFPQDIFSQRYKLENLTREKALLAAVKPAEVFDLSIEETLLHKLIDDLEDQGLEAPNLQIVLHYLYHDAVEQGLWIPEKRSGRGLTLDRYLALGETKTILNSYLDQVLDKLPTLEQRSLGQAILKSMVTAEKTKSAPMRAEISDNVLVRKADAEKDQVVIVLKHLRENRIIRKFGDEDRYELTHEVMVYKVWEWFSDQERQALNLDEMLKRAATDYAKFGLLLPPDRLSLAFDHADDLLPNDTELELLLLSSVEHNIDPTPWIIKMGKRQAVSILAQCLSDQKRSHIPVIAKSLGQTGSPEAIAYLEKLLHESDNKIQHAAITALVQIGPPAVLPPLYQAAMRETKIARISPIITALQNLGDKDSIQMLVTLSDSHEVPHIRRLALQETFSFWLTSDMEIPKQAIYLLGEMGDSRSIDILIKVFKRNDTLDINHEVIGALKKINNGQVIDSLCDLLDDPNPVVQDKAIYALAEIGGDQTVYTLVRKESNQSKRAWIKLLKQPNFRHEAIRVLINIADSRVVDPLIILLGDPDIEVQRKAIDALRRIGDNRAIDALVNNLNNLELRHETIQALTNIRSEKVVEPLIGLLGDPNIDVQRKAVEALGRIGDNQAIDALMKILKRPELRWDAIQALTNIRSEQVVELLIGLLDDPDIEVQRKAVDALKEIGDNRAIDALVKLINRPNLRYKAIRALTNFNIQRVVDSLLVLLDDPDIEMQRKIVDTLGEIGNNQAIDPLVKRLNRPELRREAIQALTNFRAEQVVEPLIGLLDDPDIEVQCKAVDALGKIGGNQAIDALVKTLDRPELRREAIQTLTNIRTKQVVETLIGLLDDPDIEVQRKAVDALGKIGDNRSIDALVKTLDRPELRWDAIQALTNIRSEQVVEPLIGLLDDPDIEVQRKAVDALGRIRNNRAIEALLEIVNRPEIRREIIQALRRNKAKRVVGCLVGLLDRPDIEVQRKAIDVLGEIGNVRAIDALFKLLERPLLRQKAIQALGKTKDSHIITSLVGLLDDPGMEDIRSSIIHALGEIGGEQGISALTELLERPETRQDAAQMLSSIKDGQVSTTEVISLDGSIMP